MKSGVTIEVVYREVKKSKQIWSGVRISKRLLILLRSSSNPATMLLNSKSDAISNAGE
jgi:hypothetical protein